MSVWSPVAPMPLRWIRLECADQQAVRLSERDGDDATLNGSVRLADNAATAPHRDTHRRSDGAALGLRA